nr:MAG TPA: hypothetical protein [Caudoviricetes sp.]
MERKDNKHINRCIHFKPKISVFAVPCLYFSITLLIENQ